MTLGRGGKITLGVLTAITVVSPFLFVGVFMALMFASVFMIAGADTNAAPPPAFLMPFGMFFVVMPLQFVFVFLLLGLQVFYYIHLVKHPTAPEMARILLGLGFFFLPYLAMPIYFFMYVWPPAAGPARTVPPAPPAPALSTPDPA